MKENNAKGITKTYDLEDVDVSMDSDRGLETAEQKNTFNVVHDRIRSMDYALKKSCSFQTWDETDEPNTIDDDGYSKYGGGFSWIDHWNQCERDYYRLRSLNPERSNLKSSTVYTAVEAFVTEANEENYGVSIRPLNDKYRSKSYIYEPLYKQIARVFNFEDSRQESLWTYALKGTCITYNGAQYMEEEGEEIMSPDEAKKEAYKNPDKTKKSVDENKPLTKKKKEKKLIFIREDVPLEEMRFDPDATSINGGRKPAVDCARITELHVDVIKEYLRSLKLPGLNKDIIDNITPSKEVTEKYKTMEDRPFDYLEMSESEAGVLIHYWNRVTKKLIIIVNDMLLYEGKLPYKHGKLPFSSAQLVKNKRSIYGFGFGMLLMDIKAEKDVYTNYRMENTIRSVGNWVYDIMVESDIDNFDTNQSAQKIGIDGEGDDIRKKFAWVQPQMNMFEIKQLIGYFDQEEVKLTHINPTQYALPEQGEAVRNNLMGQASGQRSIRKFLKSWARAEVENVRQLLGKNGLVRQFVTQELLDEGALDDIKYIQTEGFKLEEIKHPTKEGYYGFNKLASGSDHTTELIRAYIDDESELDFNPEVDALLPDSRQLRLNNVEAMMEKVLPLILNPMFMKNYLAVEMVRGYIQEVNPPNKDRVLSMMPKEDMEGDVEEAEKQNILITNYVRAGKFNNPEEQEFAQGHPGASKSHVDAHFKFVRRLQVEKNELMKMQQQLSAVQPNMGADGTLENAQIAIQQIDQALGQLDQVSSLIAVNDQITGEILTHAFIDMESPELAATLDMTTLAQQQGQPSQPEGRPPNPQTPQQTAQERMNPSMQMERGSQFGQQAGAPTVNNL